MNLMNTHVFILDKNKPAINFKTESGVGEIKLINFLVEELNGKSEVEYLNVLNKYVLEIRKKFEKGITEGNNVALTTFMLTTHKMPIFPVDYFIEFGEVVRMGHNVLFNEVEFKISTYDGKPIEHTFKFSYEKNPLVKEVSVLGKLKQD